MAHSLFNRIIQPLIKNSSKGSGIALGLNSIFTFSMTCLRASSMTCAQGIIHHRKAISTTFPNCFSGKTLKGETKSILINPKKKASVLKKDILPGQFVKLRAIGGIVIGR